MNARIQQVEEDLQYVRSAVRRGAAGPFPAAIALLWAAISLAGFALMDFAPRQAPLFWGIAGPAGFLLSLWLGMRSARAAGEEDRAEGRRWAAHWLGLLVAIALAVLAAVAGEASWDAAGATILLLLAIVYYTAGIHLHRALLPVAAILAIGYVFVLYADGRTWTWIGVATAAALVASAFLGGRKRRA